MASVYCNTFFLLFHIPGPHTWSATDICVRCGVHREDIVVPSERMQKIMWAYIWIAGIVLGLAFLFMLYHIALVIFD